MNSCEINFVRNLKKELKSEEEINAKLDQIAHEGGIQNKDAFQRWALTMLRNSNTNVYSTPATSIFQFFYYTKEGRTIFDSKAAMDFKQKVKAILMHALFHTRSFGYEMTNKQVTELLGMVVSKIRNESLKLSDLNSELLYYYNNTSSEEKFRAFRQDSTRLAQYFIATQLPLVVKAFMSDIMVYDPETNMYRMSIKAHIKQNWSDNTDEKPAEMNGLLKMMCDQTPMYVPDADGVLRPQPNSKITQNAFMWAWNKVFNSQRLTEEQYQEAIENPRSLIKLIQNEVFGTVDDSKRLLKFGTLESSIIRSFAMTWLNPNSNFYKNFSNTAFNSQATNPLEVIIANLRKYTLQNYVEYDVNGETQKLSLELGDGGQAYSRIIDNIEENKKELMMVLENAGLVVTDSKGVKTISSSIFDSDSGPSVLNLRQLGAFKQLFGSRLTIVNMSDFSVVKLGLETFVDFYNSGFSKFSDFRSEHDKRSAKGERKISAIFIDICNNITRYNPYAVEGAIKNALNKSLPTIGLKNVGNNINDEIRLNRIHKKENDAAYQRARALDQNRIVMPTSPAAHSFLYNTTRADVRTQLYRETIYRSSLSAKINGEPQVKDPSSWSQEEWFEVTANVDILKPLFNSSETLLRIEAITPSDKSKIPIFCFNKKVFIKQYAGDKDIKNLLAFNQELKKSFQKQIQNYYQQYLLNSINDFAQVFNLWDTLNIKKFSSINDITGNKLKYLNDTVNKINKWLIANDITVRGLNETLFAFNNKFGLNKNIARYQDYDIVDRHIQISPFSVKACNAYDESKNFETFYTILQDSLHKFPPTFELDGRTAKSYLDENGKLKRDENGVPEILGSKFFTFFATQGILSTELLVNVVGLPLSHKYGGGDFLKMDSKGQLTMVKRMVALTATMHQCNRNVLTGLPNQTKMMTIDVQKIKMFTYAGTTIDDNGWQSVLECWDGAMLATGISHALVKQSIGDVKPGGIDLKLLMHDYNQEKAGAHLPKLASYAITNALIRMFGNVQARSVGAFNPESIVMLQLRPAVVRESDIKAANGVFINYRGSNINFMNRHKIITDNGQEIICTAKWTYDTTTHSFHIKYIGASADNKGVDVTENVLPYLTGNFTYNNGQIIVSNNLFNVWKYIFGGENSCDINGNYNEGSMENIVTMLNVMGTKTNPQKAIVEDQNDIDQYLKKQIVHFFPTQTVQKALQAPVVNLNDAIDRPESAVTLRYNIEHFGLQMDADHEAEDSTIHEITQLISFISEHGYAPELVRDVYKQLAELLTIVGQKVFLDPKDYVDDEKYNTWRNKVDDFFSKMLTRVFTDPNLDVKSYANEVAGELDKLNLKIPFSDHQFLGKAHTTIGSYLNKFIARNWTGRADVLMPSHNLFMVYEDEDGIQYTNQDFKINPDGSKTRITRHLHDLVWNENGQMKQEFQDKFIVSNPYEFMPGLVYYRIPSERYLDENIESPEVEVVVMDDWNKIQEAKFELEKEPTERKYTYFKAIDLPRNLLPKHVFIGLQNDAKSFKVGLYHIKTIQTIADIGNRINNPQDGDNTNTLLADKKKLQKRLDAEILPVFEKINNNEQLSERDLQVLYDELPESIKTQIGEDLSTYQWGYIQKDSESLTTNNYSGIYGIKDMSIPEIRQRGSAYFKEKLVQRFTEDAFALLPEGYTLYTNDAKATKVLTYAEASSKLRQWVEVTPIVNEDGFVVTEDGKPLYKLPKGAKVYSNIHGRYSETIIVTDYISRPKESNPNEIYLLDSNYWCLYTNPNGLPKLFGIQELKLNNESNLEEDPVINTLAEQQYQSFLKALDDIVARIPAQSMAFAMVMRNIGYLPFNNNLRLVPLEHFYIQGSDVDIDKAYALMAYLNRNGIYNERISHLKFVDRVSQEDAATWALHERISNIIKTNNWNNTPDNLEGLQQLLRDAFNTMSTVKISRQTLMELADVRTSNAALVKVIDLLETTKFITNDMVSKGMNSVNVMQNSMRQNIIDLYHNPRTLFVANYPTTMVPVRTAVEESGASKELRNSLDPTTNILVNQTCSVGKKGVGISANSTKAFYAETTKYEKKYERGESTLKPTSFGVLPVDWRYNGMDHLSTLGFSGARINQATINDLIKHFDPQEENNTAIMLRDVGYGNRIMTQSDKTGIEVQDHERIFYKEGVVFREISTTLSNNSDVILNLEYSIAYLDPNDFSTYPTEELLRQIVSIETKNNEEPQQLTNIINSISNWKEVKIGSDLTDLTCTLLNGAVISSATDNAKEMTMDLLNMVPEVLPAYEYLVSLGISISQASKIFLDPIIPYLVQQARGNLFKGIIGTKRISTYLNNIFRSNDNKDVAIKNIAAEFGSELSPSMYKTIARKLEILKNIFKGADELTTEAQVLSINGGIKVETGDQLDYQLNFKTRIGRQLGDENEVDLYSFLTDAEYANRLKNNLQGKVKTYNVLDTLLSVSHFYSMLQVPMQFRLIMEGVSSDIKYAFEWLEKRYTKFEINKNNVNKVLRAINNQKILDFLHSLNFPYKSSLAYMYDNSQISNNTSVDDTGEAHDYNLNDNGYLGVINFKKHVETFIYSQLLQNEKYADNAFVQNITKNSYIWGLTKTRVIALASNINLTDPQNSQDVAILKTAFSEIKDDIIDGHTIEEWFFLYDLLVYHHQLNRNAFTVLFGNIGGNKDNIVAKWIKFVNNWDATKISDLTINELSSLDLEKTDQFERDENRAMAENAQEYGDNGVEEVKSKKPTLPQWLRPNLVPLYVNILGHTSIDYANRNIITNLINWGIIFTKFC